MATVVVQKKGDMRIVRLRVQRGNGHWTAGRVTLDRTDRQAFKAGIAKLVNDGRVLTGSPSAIVNTSEE